MISIHYMRVCMRVVFMKTSMHEDYTSTDNWGCTKFFFKEGNMAIQHPSLGYHIDRPRFVAGPWAMEWVSACVSWS